MNQPRIAALVSSFNRPDMVRRCITALRRQTVRPDGMIVADGSTQPGPREWLAQQPDVTLVRIENKGSAANICAGMERALADGYEWVWLFDDDVVPEPTALEELQRALELRPDFRVLNSLAVSETDRQRPPFGALAWRENLSDTRSGTRLFSVAEIQAHADADGFVDTVGGQLYQGTLVHRQVLEHVGLPRPALFMRGDEVEFALRIMRAGYHIYTFVPSVVSHPESRIVFFKVFGREFPCESMSALKRYYSLRNSLYIQREYYPGTPLKPYAARRLAGAFITELIVDRTKSARERTASCAAAWRGVRDGFRFQA